VCSAHPPTELLSLCSPSAALRTASVAIEKNQEITGTRCYEDFYNYNPLFYDADTVDRMFVTQPNRAGATDE